MKTAYYIMGDFSPFRSDCWFACSENKWLAKQRIGYILTMYPYGSASLVGSLDNMKKAIRLNPTRTFFKRPYKIK